jgi:SAM-dependent methyltransferase
MALVDRLGFLFGERKSGHEILTESPHDDVPPVDKLLQAQLEIGPLSLASVVTRPQAVSDAPSAQATPASAATLDLVRAELEGLTAGPRPVMTARPAAAPESPPPASEPKAGDVESLCDGEPALGGAGIDISAELARELKGLIGNALRRQYISTSSHMDYKTGNAYQAVDLGEGVIGGYRRDRSRLFDAFDFSDRTVLDCGCNIGELSRQARRRGAALVDGIEYDSYFVRIAQLINAYRGTTRVSYSQGDLTKSGTIKDHYDVSMVFSVFPYILPTLDELAAATREMLILETHDVSANLRPLYIRTVSQYFPYHSFVAFSDFGHGQGKRAVIAFTKQEKALHPGGVLSSTVDLTRSSFGFADPIMELVRQIVPAETRTKEDIARVVKQATDVPYDIPLLTAGRTYWLRMMAGYLRAQEQGQVTLDNPYVQTLKSSIALQGFDPALTAELGSDAALIDRVRRRFADIDCMSAGGNGLTPITVFDFVDDSTRFKVFNGSVNALVGAGEVDGYHRIFWAHFFGLKAVPAIYKI